MRRTLTALPIAALLLIAPGAAVAQVKLEMTPFFASYYATAKTRQVPDSAERQEAGPGIGVQLTYRFNPVIGIQGTVSHVWSGIIPTYPPSTIGVINTLQPTPGTILFANLRGTLQPRRSNYFIAAGLGITHRDGRAWDVEGIEELTDVTGSVGLGIRARVTPEFAFNIGVDLNLYMSDFDGTGPTGGYYGRRLQRDVLVTIGVPIALKEN